MFAGRISARSRACWRIVQDLRRRPRAGRSRWRPIYRRVQPRTFVILATAPEAQIDKRRFAQKIKNARQRFEELEPATSDHIDDSKLAIIPARPKGKA